MKLSIGISPCPNDTFIFDALYNNCIDISPFTFEFIFEDVETLNKLALQGKLDVIKLSYANYFNVLDQYIMLNAGGALGTGVGPMLISKQQYHLTDIDSLVVGIPGQHTTANFLLSYAFPFILKKKEIVFSEIERAVLNKQVDVGVIIHENRFTYKERGLTALMDLGIYWEQKTQLPIPLGGIAIRRSIDEMLQQQVNKLIKDSLAYSRTSYPVLSNFVKSKAQEMNEEVMRKHIDLYVNEYSVDLGHKGKMAVRKMADTLKVKIENPLFVI